jgi:hypothetical protein
MRTLLHTAATCIAASLLAACTYYVQPDGTAVPAGYSAPGAPASFDRSFAAAAGAMRDEGLAITTEDRNAGRVIGVKGSGTVIANVRSQADGSVRVQFDSRDVSDATLLDRVSRGYDRRMGR